MRATASKDPRLGLRANLGQFALLVGVNALVGGMVGQERTVVPLLGERTFHLSGYSAALSFIAAFGAAKAITNLFAGRLCDRIGRKPVLITGWLLGVPVPLLIIWAPSWSWVVAANVLLGVNQGLTWSTTVIMKIDLVGPERRGMAMGLNEFAGYVSVAVTALLTGYIAQQHGLRPGPFFVGLAYAGFGLALSAFVVQETRDHARLEATDNPSAFSDKTASEVFRLTSFTERALSACSQAGLVNNLNDGMAWGIFPLFFAQHGQSVERIAILAAVYPAVWGIGQLATGALSDRIGRKTLIASGMVLQGVAIAALAGVASFGPWVLSVFVLGVGTAMVYPTLLAAIGDVADPLWRASAVGTYRFWRDGGFLVGAVVSGVLADVLGLRTAIFVVACITALSGVIVAVRMYETHPKNRR